MATESGDDTDISASMPPELADWLDERAADLGVDRGELLRQLASAYRAASELDDDAVAGPAALDDSVAGVDDLEALVAEHDAVANVENRLEALESLHDEDVEALESAHEEDVDDLRNRVLQLRDAVREISSEITTADTVERIEERTDDVAEELEDVAEDHSAVAGRLEEVDDRLTDTETKLDRLARVTLGLRRTLEELTGDDRTRLEELRAEANRLGVSWADCDACGESVNLALLSDPACPHCETALRGVETTSSVLDRALNRRRVRLVGETPPALEAGDE